MRSRLARVLRRRRREAIELAIGRVRLGISTKETPPFGGASQHYSRSNTRDTSPATEASKLTRKRLRYER